LIDSDFYAYHTQMLLMVLKIKIQNVISVSYVIVYKQIEDLK